MITILSVLLIAGLVALLVAGAFVFVHVLPYLLIIGVIVVLYLIFRWLARRRP